MPPKKPSPVPADLLYADSEHNADQRYLGKVRVPDPFLSFRQGGRRVALVSALEFTRVRKESAFDEVLSLEECQERARRTLGVERPDPRHLVQVLAADYQIPSFRVARDFPAGLAFDLQASGVKLEVAAGALFPERERKDDAEAAEIRRANGICAAAYREVERILTECVIQGRRLLWEGKTLTSERLRTAIGIVCLERGADPGTPIVAGGDQACDPHCQGSGPLAPHSLIIVDIFPRLQDSGYHGDMTRTYLKGTASDAQRKLVDTVRKAQRHALSIIRAGRNGQEIYQEVFTQMAQAGFETRKVDGVNVGFFHGLGHGLGLEIHEPPRMAKVDAQLQPGQVVTVEPGLYYPGLGGCRWEDVVRVREDGVEMLSKHPYRWQF